MKPLKIYIAGRYSSDNIIDGLKNIARGQKAAAELFELGFAPFSPWWDRSFILDNPEGTYTKQMFYDASLEWMKVSDAVYVISGQNEGGGVDVEIDIAYELHIPFFYEIEDVLEFGGVKFLKD